MMTVSPTLRRQERELEQLLEQGGRCDDPSLSPLLDLATSLRRPAPLHADPDFRAGLRARLVAEMAERPAPARTPRARRPAPPRAPRLRQAVAGALVVAIAAGAGSALAASRALPGDPLYGLKRDIEKAQLALSHGDVDRGRTLLEQADHRLGEVERMTAGEDARSAATEARISAALTSMDGDVRTGTDLLTQAYRDSGDPEPMQILHRFLADERERLTDLLPLLPPQLAAQVSDLLELLAQIDTGATAVLGGAALATSGVGGLQALATSLGGTGATTAGSAGSAAGTLAGGSGGTAGTTGSGSTSVGGVVGSLGSAVGGVVGGLTGSGGTSGSTSGGTSSIPLPLPLPKVSVPPLLPSPTPTATSTSGGILPGLPVPTPTVSTCVPLPPITTC